MRKTQDASEKKRECAHSRASPPLNLKSRQISSWHTGYVFEPLKLAPPTRVPPCPQHCCRQQRGETQQQAQGPGQTVTPLKRWFFPFQPAVALERFLILTIRNECDLLKPWFCDAFGRVSWLDSFSVSVFKSWREDCVLWEKKKRRRGNIWNRLTQRESKEKQPEREEAEVSPGCFFPSPPAAGGWTRRDAAGPSCQPGDEHLCEGKKKKKQMIYRWKKKNRSVFLHTLRLWNSPLRKPSRPSSPLAAASPDPLTFGSRNKNNTTTAAGNTASALSSPVVTETADTSATPTSSGSCAHTTGRGGKGYIDVYTFNNNYQCLRFLFFSVVKM